MKEQKGRKNVGKKGLKKLKVFIACIVCIAVIIPAAMQAEAAKVLESTRDTNKQYTNIYSMYTSFTVTEGALWWKKTVNYNMSAKFNSAQLILINNLSGTKYWAGSKSDAIEMKIGISRQVSVKKTTSVEVSGSLGLNVPIKAVEVSGKLGGSYTKAETFEKTLGTSSEYTLSRNSKAGYYAVIAYIEADKFDVKVFNCKTKETSTGQILKYNSNHLIERLYRKNNNF